MEKRNDIQYLTTKKNIVMYLGAHQNTVIFRSELIFSELCEVILGSWVVVCRLKALA